MEPLSKHVNQYYKLANSITKDNKLSKQELNSPVADLIDVNNDGEISLLEYMDEVGRNNMNYHQIQNICHGDAEIIKNILLEAKDTPLTDKDLILKATKVYTPQDKPPIAPKEDYAVLLIDATVSGMQQKSVNSKQETANMQAILQKANDLNIPVFEITIKNNNPTSPDFMKLQSDNWIHFEKPHHSAFDETNLAETLEKMGVKEVLILGWNQFACAIRTAEDANMSGFKVHTSYDVIQGSNRKGEIQVTDQDEINRYNTGTLTPFEKGTNEYIKKEDGSIYKQTDADMTNNDPHIIQTDKKPQVLQSRWNRNSYLYDSYKDLPIFLFEK